LVKRIIEIQWTKVATLWNEVNNYTPGFVIVDDDDISSFSFFGG
jgi:hypothetical protein